MEPILITIIAAGAGFFAGVLSCIFIMKYTAGTKPGARGDRNPGETFEIVPYSEIINNEIQTHN